MSGPGPSSEKPGPTPAEEPPKTRHRWGWLVFFVAMTVLMLACVIVINALS